MKHWLIAALVCFGSSANALTIRNGGTFGGPISAGGSGTFKVATSTFGVGGVIGAVNYTQVVDTMTKVAGAGNLTVFSTITIPGNTLARNGDAIELVCSGTFNAASENHTQPMKIGAVVISSKTVAGGVAGSVPGQVWENVIRLIRVSAGNQIRQCVFATGSGACTGSATQPFIGSGTNTIDETQAMVFTCNGDGVVAGSMSFLYSYVRFIPGP